MKINQLISSFTIHMSNDEARVYKSIKAATYLHEFNERDRFIIENLVRKSLISKVKSNGSVMVIKND
jgi:hypothetical protein